MSKPLDRHTSSKPYRRSALRIVINPKYQIKYIFFLSASALSIILSYSFLTYYYVKENYSLLIELSPMTDESKLQLYSELNHLILRILGCSLLFIVTVSLLGLIFSHRTAGPLYHFKKVFNEIKKGNKSARIHLRPKDDFQDVAKEFNEMMDSIS